MHGSTTLTQAANCLFDANIWRYISDADAAEIIRQAASRNKIRIQVAPSVVYEALRTKDAVLRAKLLKLMTRPYWVRLMPEVRDEAHEFLTEVRRVRPEWLNGKPNRELARRLQFDWVRANGGFWDRARLTPDAEASALTLVEGTMIDEARAFAEDARHSFIDASLKFETVSLIDLRARPTLVVKGWNGQVVEPWRIAALVVVSNLIELDNTSHAFVEWLANEVDHAKALFDRASWNRFWLHEVQLVNMPRHWLRWAFEMLQTLRRVTAGTPCDAQLGAYLTQCDWFFTADRAFGEMVTKIAEAAPFRVASAKVFSVARRQSRRSPKLLSQRSEREVSELADAAPFWSALQRSVGWMF